MTGTIRGPRGVWKALRISLAGLAAAWRSEEAFRTEAVLCAVLVPVGFWLGGSAVERALLVGSLLLVLATELLNTAIETVFSRYGDERHPLTGAAKDMGSAAVFMTMLIVALVWLGVLWGRF